MNRDYKGCVGGLLPEASDTKKGLLSTYLYSQISQESNISNGSDNSKKIKITTNSSCPILLIIRTNNQGNALVFISYSNSVFSGKVIDSNIYNIENKIKYKENLLIIEQQTSYSSIKIISTGTITKELVTESDGYENITWR